jgi:hypothetical protein
LSAHFAEEESKEYFGVVMEEAPALAPQIAVLRWEHLSILKTAERLRGAAQQRERWRSLALPAQNLVAELERHERTESTLLRQLFFSSN